MSSISTGTTTTTGYVVTSDITGTLQLKTGSSATTALTIDTSQNVGIGTGSPAYKLDVNGNVQIGNATAATNRALYINGVANKAGRIVFQESGVEKWLIGNGAASENGNFEIYSATGNNTVITPAGNLGLGVVPSATYKLDVGGYVRSNLATFGGGQYVVSKSGTTVGGLSGSGNWLGTTANDLALWAETGNALTFFSNGSATERARIETGGSLLVGTTTAVGTKLTVSGTNTGGTPLVRFTATGAGTFQRGVQLFNTSLSAGESIMYSVGINDNAKNMGQMYFTYSGSGSNSNRLSFGLHSVDDLLNLSGANSGCVMIGTTTPYSSARLSVNNLSGDGLFVTSNTGSTGYVYSAGQSTGYATYWISSAGQAGFISISGNTTSYTSGSDYRVKDNIRPIQNGLELTMRMKPSEWEWKADGSFGSGFIAHELADVCPQAVNGEKDEVNEDGSIKVQGVDTSFLVGILTAAIQEQQALIETLTQRITALEGATQ